jgi:hypothetical protein
MSRHALVSVGVLLLASLLGTGCAVDDTEEDADQGVGAVSAVTVEPGTFQLYEQPGNIPAACHRVNELVLASAGTASIRKTFGGPCPMHVAHEPPEQWAFAIRGAVDRCNSTVLTGETETNGVKRTFTITDKRRSTCDELLPSQVIMEEKVVKNGATTTTKTYSIVAPPPSPAGGTFTLYGAPNHTPDAACDVHWKLALGPENFATLYEDVRGGCAAEIDPNIGSYELQGTRDGCGSGIWTGKDKNSGITIKLTDNRTRTCEDVVPARIVIELKAPAGAAESLYSHDAR